VRYCPIAWILNLTQASAAVEGSPSSGKSRSVLGDSDKVKLRFSKVIQLLTVA
jgi:hypothetical protein